MEKKYNNKITPLAKSLRKNMTKEESHLWYDFLSKHPLKFYRQRAIGRYIVDFYCSKAKLVIELDGSQHGEEEQEKKDNERTKFLGFLNRKQVEEMYNRSRVGLCVLRKTPNHVNALAIKLFEYMAAGIPIVCSNFPLWVEIVEKNGCGICVEPGHSEKIIEAIQYLLKNPKEAKRMGDIGKQIVREKYNWDREKEFLIQKYR